MEHEYLVVADLGLRVDLGELSVRDISVALLRLRSRLLRPVVLVEILGQVDALLEPVVAAPRHRHLVEVLEQGDEPDEVGILQQLLLDEVNIKFHILKLIPFEQPVLLLDQGFLMHALCSERPADHH